MPMRPRLIAPTSRPPGRGCGWEGGNHPIEASHPGTVGRCLGPAWRCSRPPPAALAVALIALGVSLFLDRTCDTGGDCNDEIIAWLLGAPMILAGGGVLIMAAVGLRRRSAPLALACCAICAALGLGVASLIGSGAAMRMAITVAAFALVGLGVRAVREPRPA